MFLVAEVTWTTWTLYKRGFPYCSGKSLGTIRGTPVDKELFVFIAMQVAHGLLQVAISGDNRAIVAF